MSSESRVGQVKSEVDIEVGGAPTTRFTDQTNLELPRRKIVTVSTILLIF